MPVRQGRSPNYMSAGTGEPRCRCGRQGDGRKPIRWSLHGHSTAIFGRRCPFQTLGNNNILGPEVHRVWL